MARVVTAGGIIVRIPIVPVRTFVEAVVGRVALLGVMQMHAQQQTAGPAEEAGDKDHTYDSPVHASAPYYAVNL
jgi:hypothetical protein